MSVHKSTSLHCPTATLHPPAHSHHLHIHILPLDSIVSVFSMIDVHLNSHNVLASNYLLGIQRINGVVTKLCYLHSMLSLAQHKGVGGMLQLLNAKSVTCKQAAS